MTTVAHLLARLVYGWKWLRHRALRRSPPALKKLILRMWTVHWMIRLGVTTGAGLSRQLDNAEEDLAVLRAARR